ncbi:MAG: hypothetical protein RLZZ540_301 [Bacteroidota bacterium]|jgi:hypothetical protein
MSSKSAVVINFPVKPHIYKYLQKKVGEKLVVTKFCFFGGMVLDILTKKYSDLEVINDTYTFPVEISFSYMEKMGIYIDNRVAKKFNSRVDSMFREEMRGFVTTNFLANNIPKETSLAQFLTTYDIYEDDIKFETLVKDFKRNIKY